MRRPERATPKIFDRVVTENEIRPKLRFLLSDEARAEGKQMVRNFGGYTLSRTAEDTRCQFESIARGIRDGDYPNIAAADQLMGGVLVQSVEKIAGGFRQPEWMLRMQSWAHDLVKGRPDLMEGSAIRMMTRDERHLPRIVDDESDALPKTYADPVRAGGGAYAGDLKEWTPSREAPMFRRYRDFIEYLEDTVDGDKTVCIVNNPAIVSARHSVFLALKSGRGGGASLGATLKRVPPSADFEMTFRIDPATSAISLAATLARGDMMELAKTLLTPGQVDIAAVAMFAEGLRNLDVVSAEDQATTRREPPMTKPPCLDTELWRRIATHIARFMLVAALTGSRTGDIITASFYNEPGRPWVDLDNQIYYRAADGERVPHNKKANPCRIPDRLVDVMKRWRDGYGKVKPSRYLVEFAGEAADCKKAFLRLRREVMSEERAAQLNRHSFKHTCVTWLLQAGVPIEDVSIYVSTDVQTLRKTYSHVIPGEYSPVNQAFARKKRVGSETRRDRFLGENEAA